MITLYHGSIGKVSKPLINLGRSDLDFGQGFYLTRLRVQAEKWAIVISSRKDECTPWLNIYELDLDAIILHGYKILKFESYNKDWLEFIANSRSGKHPWKSYDIIEGGVADDSVIDTVEAYLDGEITAEFALGKLIYTKPNNQICILNQYIINNFLHYLESYPILITKKGSEL